MYRSKNKELMADLKSTVLQATKGFDRDDRAFALDYLRSHIKLDDLHKLAVKAFPNRPINFGVGSNAPRLVVVTKDPIGKEEKAKLDGALRRFGFAEIDVYYAHLRFVKTKKKQQDRQEILEKLVNILDPKLVIVFDKVAMNVKPEVYQTQQSVSVLTDTEKKDERKKFTRDLKKLVG